MEINITNNGNVFDVVLTGRVDTTNADDFQQQLLKVADNDKVEVTIDCSGLDYTSSQGLRVFLMLQKAISARGGKLTLSKMQPQVKEVFDITGFSSIIKII